MPRRAMGLRGGARDAESLSMRSTLYCGTRRSRRRRRKARHVHTGKLAFETHFGCLLTPTVDAAGLSIPSRSRLLRQRAETERYQRGLACLYGGTGWWVFAGGKSEIERKVGGACLWIPSMTASTQWRTRRKTSGANSLRGSCTSSKDVGAGCSASMAAMAF